MAEFMEGNADASDGVAVLAAAILNHAPTDEAEWKQAGEWFRTRANPVDWMLDLVIGIVAIQRACGIDKRDVRKMLAMVQGQIDQVTGQEMLQGAVQRVASELAQLVMPAVNEARVDAAVAEAVAESVEPKDN